MIRRGHAPCSAVLGALVMTFGVLAPPPTLAASSVLAGAAVVPLELPEGVPLAGFGDRGPGNHAQGELAPVEARALVVEGSPGGRVGLVALDILIIWPSLERAIREATEDLELAGLLVAATHTHSGPGGYVDQWIAELGIMGWFDPGAHQALVDAATLALREATGRAVPARVGSRQILVPGLSRNRRRPGGPSDPVVPILRVDATDGSPIATVFALSAHPTTLSSDNRELSPEYPGAARARVEALRGGTAVFLAGALGDQAPALPGGVLWTDDTSLPMAAQIDGSLALGRRLGEMVAEGARSIPYDHDPAVDWRATDWPLPPIDVRTRCVGFVLGPVLHRSAVRTFPREAHIEALRLGGMTLLGSPFELSVGVAEAIRARSPQPLLIATHTNGWLGYLVTPEDWEQGGYETCLSFHGGALAPAFVDEAVSTLAPLHGREAAAR